MTVSVICHAVISSMRKTKAGLRGWRPGGEVLFHTGWLEEVFWAETRSR